MRFVSLLLIFLLACGRAFAAGAAIPSGTISVNGNQLSNQAGQNIRASRVDYTGSTPATDMPVVNGAGVTTPVNWGAGNGSGALGMCNDVGAAVTAAVSGALIICEGPINPGALLAQTKPVVGTSGTPTRKPSDIPFTSGSVWNLGIGSIAQWGAPADADVITLRGLRGTLNTNYFGAPLFFGQQSDPLITLSATNPNPPGASFSVHMHVPAKAKPSADSDAAINIVDSTQPAVVFTGSNTCILNNGQDATSGISCGLGNVYNPLGDGVVDTRDFCATTVNFVCDYGQYPGIITDFDLAQGVITHAIRTALSPNVLRNPGPGGNGSGIFAPCSPTVNMWPNFCTDGNASTAYVGNIYPGTYGIPASTNLNGRGLSTGGMMLAKALQTYGTIWRDAGGSNQIVLYSTPEADTNPLIAQMRADLPTIVPLMSIMRNQSPPGPDSRGIAGQINGGGNYPTPLLPVCAQAASTIAGTGCPGVE